MSTYIVEAWHPDTADGSAVTSAKIMSRTYDPDKGHVWRYRTHTNTGFDHETGPSGTREQTVRQVVRLRLQKEPLSVQYGGETARGYLYIVEVTN
jgi:hypothetical protein